MKQASSPLPTSKKFEKRVVGFPEAIGALIGGAKIRREEWSDASEFGLLKDQYLMIHRNDKFHTWIVSEGDMLALDWQII